MVYTRIAILTALASTIIYGAAPAALAQTHRPTHAAAPPAQMYRRPKASFDNKDIKSYAMASLQVHRLAQRYSPKINAARSPKKKRAIENNEVRQMTAAVRSEGLTVKKYNQINATLRTNPKLAKRVNHYIQKAQ